MTAVMQRRLPADGATDAGAQREALLDAIKAARDLQRKSGAPTGPPWLLAIGWPGAGKTAALVESGLRFPNADRAEAARPAEATGFQYRLAEEAVFIDAPGRFAAQDVDRNEWLRALKLLKRHRPGAPLNGVLVMIAADELITLAAEERARRARAIRQRLRDIDEAFALRAPVYLVFTRLDRLAGFAGFFADLSAAGREQVLGATLPSPDRLHPDVNLPAALAEALRRLGDRVQAAQLDRLAGERDPGRRVQIFAFPRQFALLIGRVNETIAEIAASSRSEPPLRLRGAYFTSARQDGYAVDPLGQATAERFGVDLPRIGGGRGDQGFFLTRLFKEVVFVEENIVFIDVASGPGGPFLRPGLAALGAALFVALAAFWIFAYFDQQGRLAGAETLLATYSAEAQMIPTRDVADADLAKAAQSLDQIRAAAKDWPSGGLGAPALDQGAKMRSAIGDLYNRALDLILAPRLFVALQQDVQSSQRPPQEADQAAKLFLMLGGKSPLDKSFAEAALASVIDRRAPGAQAQGLRQSLKEHAAALLAKPLAPIDLDAIAVEDAKARTAPAR